MFVDHNPHIETERLTLRALTPNDASALLPIFSDPQVMRYWNTPPWTSIDDAHRFIESSAAAMAQHQSLTLAITQKSTGEVIGKCMLVAIDAASRRAEIGFGIGRAHWGQGYVLESGRALLGYGFSALGLRRVEAEIDPLNTSSAKTLQRLGFVQEGLLRQRWEIDGVISDSAMYGLLASDRAAPAHAQTTAPERTVA